MKEYGSSRSDPLLILSIWYFNYLQKYALAMLQIADGLTTS